MTTLPKRIIAAVTNDLYQDQRMHRICTSLQHAGHEVELVGRTNHRRAHREREPIAKEAAPPPRAYRQTRLSCLFFKGKMFYLEYNIRLLWRLMFHPFDAVCAVDTDTLLACYIAAVLKRKPCVLDAHEYFSEVPELAHRPIAKTIWEMVAALIIPRLRFCYTVGETLAEALTARYGVSFEVIRNLPIRNTQAAPLPHPGSPFKVLYQGMLNAGRGISQMLEAMEKLEDVQLWIAGDGDLAGALREQAQPLIQAGKVLFFGFVHPDQLTQLTLQADVGINLLEDKGLSYRYSLANKTFDYIQAGIPSIQMDFPEYQRLNDRYGVFACIPDLQPDTIAKAIRSLQQNADLYQSLRSRCLKAAEELHWATEEPKLLSLYQRALSANANGYKVYNR